MKRSVLAVLAGVLAWGVVWPVATLALQAGFPDTFVPDVRLEHPGALLTLVVLSAVLSVAAGWVTARVARTRPIEHGLVLGVLQLGLGVFFELSYWELMPVWYHLLFLALLVPGNVVGAWLGRSSVSGSA